MKQQKQQTKKERKKLFLQECAILTHIIVDFNDLGASKELHDESGSDNWGDSKFHDSPSVGSKNNTHPIEWICTCCRVYAIQRELTTYQEYE